MKTGHRLFVDGLIVSAMTLSSFLAGWWAFGLGFATSRQIDFDFSKPYMVPPGYAPLGTTPTPETASFSPGDRIDIFVERSNLIEPLVLDAIVTQQSKTNFGMLLPYGGHDLLGHAEDSGWRMIFRISIAPADPVSIVPYGG